MALPLRSESQSHDRCTRCRAIINNPMDKSETCIITAWRRVESLDGEGGKKASTGKAGRKPRRSRREESLDRDGEELAGSQL